MSPVPIPIPIPAHLAQIQPSVLVQALDLCLQGLVRRSTPLDTFIFLVGAVIGILICPVFDLLVTGITNSTSTTESRAPGTISLADEEKAGRGEGWESDNEDQRSESENEDEDEKRAIVVGRPKKTTKKRVSI